VDAVRALKNSSDQHRDGDALTRRSVRDPAPEPSVEARSEVPAPSFYGKLEYRASMLESLPSSAAGVFKGMAVILEERGFADARKLRAECKNFKCAPPALNCCCR
jgi:hypothetical protein